MSNLCATCQKKNPSHISGSCGAKPQGQPCNASTTSYDFKLCDSCSTQLDQCKWCLASLSATGSTATHSASTGIPFITVTDQDAGKTFKSMAVGEQIHIELDEDTWSGAEWDVKSCGSGLHRQIGSQFTPDPSNYQYGRRKFVIDIRAAASGLTGDIELHEVSASNYGYWYYGYQQQKTALPNGKHFKISVQVK